MEETKGEAPKSNKMEMVSAIDSGNDTNDEKLAEISTEISSSQIFKLEEQKNETRSKKCLDIHF